MMNAGSEGSEDLAYEYLNALLDPAGGKEVVNWGYGHSVPESFSLADPKVIESLGLGDVSKFFATGKIFDAVAPDKRDRLIAEWEKARVG